MLFFEHDQTRQPYTTYPFEECAVKTSLDWLIWRVTLPFEFYIGLVVLISATAGTSKDALICTVNNGPPHYVQSPRRPFSSLQTRGKSPYRLVLLLLLWLKVRWTILLFLIYVAFPNSFWNSTPSPCIFAINSPQPKKCRDISYLASCKHQNVPKHDWLRKLIFPLLTSFEI